MTALTDCIYVAPGDFNDPGTATDPFDTVEGLRFEIDPTATTGAKEPSNAFDSAIAALPANGGRLIVCPGSDVYGFADQAIVNKPCEIDFMPGARIGLNDNNARCFSVQEKHCRFVNMQVRSDIGGSTPNNRSIVTLLNSGSDAAADFQLIGGYAELAADNAVIQRFSVVQALGQSTSIRTPCLEMSNFDMILLNAKVATGNPVQQTNAWSGTEYTSEPHGLGLLYAENYRHVKVKGCSLTGELESGGFQYSGLPIILQDSIYVTVESFHVNSLTMRAATGYENLPVFLIRGTVNNEGGHTTITAPWVENIGCKHLLACVDPRWVALEGAQFGKSVAGVASVVYGQDGGESLIYQNCRTHNLTGRKNTVSGSATSTQLTGTGIGDGLVNGDVIYVGGFSNKKLNRRYVASTVTANAITTDPQPPATEGPTASVSVETPVYEMDVTGCADVTHGGNHATFRNTSEYPFKFSGVSRVHSLGSVLA